MISIWKFPLDIVDIQSIEMPFLSKAISVQFQGERLCLLVRVNTHASASKKNRLIRIVGTGNPMPELDPGQWHFVGTVQQFGGSLVWHVFASFGREERI